MLRSKYISRTNYLKFDLSYEAITPSCSHPKLLYSLREACAIPSFRNRQKMLFVYEYCLTCYKNKCLIFISKQEKRTCQHVRYISVSNKIPPHKDPFWSVMFPLSINSSKFSTEVLHTKFDLLYFVKEMFN